MMTSTYRPSLTSTVKATSAVARHLGSDLTALRCSGQRLRWWCMEGGNHIVRTSAGRYFAVDLVTGLVSLRVGTMPRKAA